MILKLMKMIKRQELVGVFDEKSLEGDIGYQTVHIKL